MAGVTCTPPDAAAEGATLQYFTDLESLRAFWQAELKDVAPRLAENDEACETDENGSRRWGFGDIACLSVGDTAQIFWTDERMLMLGAVESSNGDIPELFQWWRATARPLGRAADERPDESQEPTPSKVPRLVRVPGPPRAISCEAISDPIPDEWKRTWRIKNVEFLERGNYERVVLNLERTGKNRKGQPTQAVVERIPVSRLGKVVPSAPRPKRGATAIVVRLGGVRDAPGLQGYRPKGLDLVKELSVVRDNGGRTVVISSPADTCYQVRIPIWGPGATGDENNAKVYIDLKAKPDR